ncbi:hypothetical protein LTS18_002867 [Coniosporium uncinatum]|uniref:Uncharacterized protein n=1 Tax=Coniosporium uncinatum TaxID=93489 RepID=A0ACC3D7H1_9PEZI|nr:hypothetical protein LTS18_002867 [Coniosporium uncinatum]
MRSFIASVAVVGLASVVAAAPLAQGPSGFHGHSQGSSAEGYGSDNYVKSEDIFRFPLADGFPNPNDQQLHQIEEIAHGTLPNGPPPPKIDHDTKTSLQLIAFNENFEVAFFEQLIKNITNNVNGFQFNDKKQRDFVLQNLIVANADEQLHELNANGALKHFGFDPIEPCQYIFPSVVDLKTALATAITFTDVVMGTLGDVQEKLANAGDNSIIRGIASVIGQEGEQTGFYRSLLQKVAPELPFLTASERRFAFSALQGFVVPGSCPNENEIDLSIFAPLTVVTPPQPKDQLVKYSFDLDQINQGLTNNAKTSRDMNMSSSSAGHPGNNNSGMDYSKYDYSKLFLTLVNQQNLPISEKIQNVEIDGSTITFAALFPFEENVLNGLTIAAVTVGEGFASVVDVADHTIAGPGLIEVN